MSAGFARVARIGSAIARRFATIEVDALPSGLPGSVIVGNHTSLFDIFVGWTALSRWDRTVHFLVRASYVDKPVLGTVLRAAGAIPVRDPRAPGAGFTIAARTLAAGGDILLMPEGRLARAEERAADGVGHFYNGVGKLLAEADVPVVIAHVDGAEQVWPQGRRLPRRPAGGSGRPTVTVRFVVARLAADVGRDADVLTALVRAAMVNLARGGGLPDGLVAVGDQSGAAPNRASSSATSSGAATWR